MTFNEYQKQAIKTAEYPMVLVADDSGGKPMKQIIFILQWD